MVGSPTSPSTRNSRLFEPVSSPGRMSRSSSSHTRNNDDGVPPNVTASFSGPPPRGFPDGLQAVAEEAPSSNASEGEDGDVAQMSKSISYMDGRPSLHLRWLSQDGNRPRLDWIIDEGETPRPKIVLVGVGAFPFFHFPTRRWDETDHRFFLLQRIKTRCEALPFLADRINHSRCIEPFSPWA